MSILDCEEEGIERGRGEDGRREGEKGEGSGRQEE